MRVNGRAAPHAFKNTHRLAVPLHSLLVFLDLLLNLHAAGMVVFFFVVDEGGASSMAEDEMKSHQERFELPPSRHKHGGPDAGALTSLRG